MQDESNWREVSRQEFFKVIGPFDVFPTVEGSYPYTNRFLTPSGQAKGQALPVATYFLPE